jgi:hypothetical protein
MCLRRHDGTAGRQGLADRIPHARVVHESRQKQQWGELLHFRFFRDVARQDDLPW